MLMPWWSLAASGSSGTASFEFGLAGLCVRPSSVCASYGTLSASEPVYRSVEDVFGIAFGIASVALLSSLLAFVLSLLRSRISAGGTAVGILGLVSGISALSGPVYILLALPGAVASLPYGSSVAGFFGELTTSGTTISYGGGLGWAASLGASALVLICGPGMVALERRKRSG